jgi:hypothetical protein
MVQIDKSIQNARVLESAKENLVDDLSSIVESALDKLAADIKSGEYGTLPTDASLRMPKGFKELRKFAVDHDLAKRDILNGQGDLGEVSAKTLRTLNTRITDLGTIIGYKVAAPAAGGADAKNKVTETLKDVLLAVVNEPSLDSNRLNDWLHSNSSPSKDGGFSGFQSQNRNSIDNEVGLREEKEKAVQEIIEQSKKPSPEVKNASIVDRVVAAAKGAYQGAVEGFNR